MKYFKEIIKKIIGGVLTISILVGGAMIGGTIETHYSRDGFVSEINNNEIVIVDTTDNEWIYELENNETFSLYDNVTMKMYNGCTDDNMYDDEILKVVKR